MCVHSFPPSSGLVPEDFVGRAKVDEVLNYCEDFISAALVPTMSIADPAAKIAAREALIAPEGALTLGFKRLQTLLERSGTGYFHGPSVTIADLKINSVLEWFSSGKLDGIPATFIPDNFPALQANYDLVTAHPKIVEWRASHPQ